MRAVRTILKELKKAQAKHPDWPCDVVHCAAIMIEEAGEEVQASIDFHYGNQVDTSQMRLEAGHTGAMAIRLLMGLDDLEGQRQ